MHQHGSGEDNHLKTRGDEEDRHRSENPRLYPPVDLWSETNVGHRSEHGSDLYPDRDHERSEEAQNACLACAE